MSGNPTPSRGRTRARWVAPVPSPTTASGVAAPSPTPAPHSSSTTSSSASVAPARFVPSSLALPSSSVTPLSSPSRGESTGGGVSGGGGSLAWGDQLFALREAKETESTRGSSISSSGLATPHRSIAPRGGASSGYSTPAPRGDSVTELATILVHMPDASPRTPSPKRAPLRNLPPLPTINPSPGRSNSLPPTASSAVRAAGDYSSFSSSSPPPVSYPPDTPLLANGRPNLALISARAAFAKKKSPTGLPGMSLMLGGDGAPSLIPGINDSPPRKASPKHNLSLREARAQAMALGTVRTSLGAVGAPRSSPRSSSVGPAVRTPAPAATPTTTIEEADEPAPIVKKPLRTPRFGGAPGQTAAHARVAAKAKLRAAKAAAWNWVALRASFWKRRPARPVIGGKLAVRPTLRYTPPAFSRVLFALHRYLHSMPYQVVMLVSILVALFATDFTFAFLAASVDPATSLVLFIVLLGWAMDATVNFVLHSNYFGSLYGWCDLIAIMSLVVDVACVTGTQSCSGHALNAGWSMGHAEHSYYSIGATGDMSFLAQLSGVLKTLRLLKLARPVNLLARKLRKRLYEHGEARRCLGASVPSSTATSTASDDEFSPSRGAPGGPRLNGSFTSTLPQPPPSQLGTILADFVSVRTLILVVTLGCLVPVLVTNIFSGLITNQQLARSRGLEHFATSFASLAEDDVSGTLVSTSSWPINTAQAVNLPILLDAYLAAYATPAMQSAHSGRLLGLDGVLVVTPSSGSAVTFSDTFKTWDTTVSRGHARYGLEVQTLVVTSDSFTWILPSSEVGGTGSTLVSTTATLTLTASFDSASALHQAAWLHLLLQLLLVLAYLFSSLSLARALGSLVVQPFERIVAVVWTITKSLGIVSAPYRAKNYGSAEGGSQSSPHGSLYTPPSPVPLSTRVYRDLKSAFLPCRVRAYEVRMVDDLVSKLARIFHVQPAGRHLGAAGSSAAATGLAANGVAPSADGPSKSMRVLTGTRVTELQTSTTLLTVAVHERPLEREIKGRPGTPQPTGARVRVKHYGDGHRRRTSLSSADEAESTAPSIPGRRLTGSELSVSRSLASGSSQLAAPHSPSAMDRVEQRAAAHASALSAVQSRIVAGGQALGLASRGPPATVASPLRRQSTKAALLLGFSPARGSLLGGAVGSGTLNAPAFVDDREHPELGSLDVLLTSPLALTHFRAFLGSKRSLECFLFHVAVLSFQQELLARAQRIESTFIRIGAAHEVNIPSEVRDEVQGRLGGQVGLLPPGLDLFDRAQGEVISLLRGSFHEFVHNEAALNYLAEKMKERVLLGAGPATQVEAAARGQSVDLS